MGSVLREGGQASRGQDWEWAHVCSHRDFWRRALAEATTKVGGHVPVPGWAAAAFLPYCRRVGSNAAQEAGGCKPDDRERRTGPRTGAKRTWHRAS